MLSPYSCGDYRLRLRGLLAAIFLVPVVSAFADPADLDFNFRVDFTAGDRPFAVALADLTGDEVLDLAVPNFNDNSVAVFFGTGDGTFTLDSTYAVGTNPNDCIFVDVTGDARRDLVVANKFANTISILPGNGDGTFGAESTVAAGFLPASVAAGRFDDNETIDLVVANYSESEITILLGNGDGTFGPGEEIPVGNAPFAVTTGLVDNDHIVDLVVANSQSNSVSVLIGDGTGSFAPAVSYPVAIDPCDVIIRDLNDDSINDVVTANKGSEVASVLIGRGDGTLDPFVAYPVGAEPITVAAADFDADRVLDLVVANSGSDDVSVLLGIGDGTFASAVTFPAGDGAHAVGADDFDSDLIDDIIVANARADSVTVLLNRSTLSDIDRDDVPDVLDNCPDLFNPFQEDSDGDGIGDICDIDLTDLYDVTEFDSADVYSVEIRDLDRDNNQDIVFTGTVDTGLFISYGDSFGGLESPPVKLLDAQRLAIAIGHIDDDGRLDIAAASLTQLYTLLADGPRSYVVDSIPLSSTSEVSRGRSAGAILPILSLGYLTDDRQLDFLVSPGAVLEGDGAGGIRNQAAVSTLAIAAAVGDFTNDGLPDLCVVEAATAVILENNGMGGYDSVGSFFVDTSVVVFTDSILVPIAIVLADINRDLNLDVALSTPNRDSTGLSLITVALGDGSGGMVISDTALVPGLAYDIALTDSDRDNELDLIAANGTGRSILVYTGDGTGQFDFPVTFPIASEESGLTLALATGDLDRDGQPDFVSGGLDSGTIILATSTLADLPVSDSELTVTGFSNIDMTLMNPLGYELSTRFQTIAGGEVAEYDVDRDDKLDQQLLDLNVILEEYSITVRLKDGLEEADSNEVQLIVKLDGLQERELAGGEYRDFLPVGARINPSGSLLRGTSFEIGINLDTATSVRPFEGLPGTVRPTLDWSRTLDPASATNYIVELSDKFNFSTVLVRDSGLTEPELEIMTTLLSERNYYWRYKASFDGGRSYGEFSRPFSLRTESCCLDGVTGDANCDGTLDLTDITTLIDHLFLSFAPLCCIESTDPDISSRITLQDLTIIINGILLMGELPPCP